MKYILKFILVTIVLTLGIVLDTVYMILIFPYAMIYNYLLIRDFREVLWYWINDLNDAANTAFKMSRDFIFT